MSRAGVGASVPRSTVALVLSASMLAAALPPAAGVVGRSAPASPAAAAPASAGTPLGRLVTPTDGALVRARGGAVVVRYRLTGNARLAQLQLNGADVTSRATTRGRDVTARIPAGRAEPGTNVLLARFATDRRSTFSHTRFTLVRDVSGLVRVSTPRSGGRERARPLTVRIEAPPKATVDAWLNGTRVSARLDRPRSGRWAALLGPSAGLRHGSNSVRVRALLPDGRLQTVERRVTVASNGPIADAGRDRDGTVGRAVRLDGRASLPAPEGTGALRHSWRVTSAPPGSSPVLTRERGARPVLRADRPGSYVLRATVAGDRGPSRGKSVPAAALASSSDFVTVAVQPTQTAVPVTVGTSGGATGITVGDAFYASTVDGPGVQLLVLERDTLGLVANQAQPAGQMADLEPVIQQYATAPEANDTFLVVASLPGGPPTRGGSDTAALLSGLIALGPEVPPGIDPTDAFGVVAVPDPDAPQAAASWTVRLPLDGWFSTSVVTDAVPSDTFAWTFLFADQVPVTVGDGITVGSQTFPAPSVAAGAGGFQLVTLDQIDLSSATSTFFAMPAQAAAMATALTAAVKAGQVVAIDSVGTLPNPLTVQDQAPDYQAIGAQLATLGGSADVFVQLSTGDTYSFLGPNPAGQNPAETSTRITGASTSLTTILQRSSSGAYRVLTGDSTGTAGFSQTLPGLAYQAPVGWPTDAVPGQAAAVDYISTQTNLGCDATGGACDVRVEYVNLNVTGDTGTLGDLIEEVPYPCAKDRPDCVVFTEADLAAAKSQLLQELAYVGAVWGLVQNLQAQYVDSTTGVSVTALDDIGSTITNALVSSKSTGAVVAEVLSFVTDALWAASLIPGVGSVAFVVQMAGVLAVAAATAGDIATYTSGTPATTVSDTASGLALDIEQQMSWTGTGLGVLGDIVVEDWGRLQAVGQLALGQWATTTQNLAPLGNAVLTGVAQSMYAQLMPVAYEAYYMSEMQYGGTVSGLNCGKASLENEPGTGQIALAYSPPQNPSYPGEPDNLFLFRVYALYQEGKDIDDPFASDTPPATVTDPIFATATGSQQPKQPPPLPAAAAYPDWWWTRAYLTGAPLKSTGCGPF